ncbi:MAG TPA: DUF6364 family protein [bacterium]|nr:DUF6364 family protein [bacterium]HPR87690.1 DUF6364 family protein [bacterium]
MDAKLTLKLDKHIIEKAKSFARVNHTSLSHLVEGFFERLIEPDHEELPGLPPTVNELVGVLKIRDKSDIEVSKEQYLLEKYLHE